MQLENRLFIEFVIRVKELIQNRKDFDPNGDYDSLYDAGVEDGLYAACELLNNTIRDLTSTSENSELSKGEL